VFGNIKTQSERYKERDKAARVETCLINSSVCDSHVLQGRRCRGDCRGEICSRRES
jgi:hypothetical protein